MTILVRSPQSRVVDGLGSRDETPAAPRGGEDVAFFQRVFSEELGFVWGSLRRLGIHERDVEDVTQEVFVRVYKKLDAYDRSRPMRPWLFAFAVHAASDYRRLARHRVELLQDAQPDAPSGAPLPDELHGERDRAALVERALEQVPLDRRAVLIAFELDDQPMKEVADALGIPLFTAYSRLRVAREEFRVAVERLTKQGGHP